MTEKLTYWLTFLFSVVALVLLLANTALIEGNRRLQEQATQQQAIINNANNVSQLNQGLAQALAEIVIKEKDKDIESLLASQGISVRKEAAAAPAPASAEQPAKKK